MSLLLGFVLVVLIMILVILLQVFYLPYLEKSRFANFEEYKRLRDYQTVLKPDDKIIDK